ncbi:MAG: hypothetical protein RLZZ148_743 [Cyanobacteriota bacterium]
MLTYIIAIAGIAFFSPDVHRQDDFLWSGVGLFYALVLWICAERITGAVLLGQTAAAILIISFGWQTLQLRRTPGDAQSLGFSLLSWLQSSFGPVTSRVTPAVETIKTKIPPSPAPVEEETVSPKSPEKSWLGFRGNPGETIPMGAPNVEEFAQFDEAEKSLDEDVTETSEIKLESAHSMPENPEVPRVVVGIYDLAEDSPVEPLIYPNAVAEDVTPTEHP